MTYNIPFISRAPAALQSEWIAALNAVMTHAHIMPLSAMSQADIQSTNVAIVANPDPTEVNTLPNLKWVQSLWAGVEGMLAELTNPAIKIVRLSDPQMAKTMAEAVLAWTLYLHRDMPTYYQQQYQSLWSQHPVPRAQERTIGILGMGNMGKQAAHKLTQNGFNVCGWSRSGCSLDGVDSYAGDAGLKTMLARCHILIALLPLTAQTKGLLNERTLQYLPKDASIINFARGPILVDSDLIKMLDCAHLNHAVLDVFDVEPLPKNHPFWAHPNITVLPHISAPTNINTASKIVAGNINMYIKHGNIPSSVNRTQGY